MIDWFIRIYNKVMRPYSRPEDGPTMIEYGLIVALIALVAILTITVIPGNIEHVFCDIADRLGRNIENCPSSSQGPG